VCVRHTWCKWSSELVSQSRPVAPSGRGLVLKIGAGTCSSDMAEWVLEPARGRAQDSAISCNCRRSRHANKAENLFTRPFRRSGGLAQWAAMVAVGLSVFGGTRAETIELGELSIRVTSSLVVGSGSAAAADGVATAAEFSALGGLAAVNDSFVAVADKGSHRIRLIDVDTGATSTIAGGDEGYYDDHNGQGLSLFSSPSGLARLPGSALLVVADAGNNVIRVVDSRSSAVWTLAGSRTAGIQASACALGKTHAPG
jgi:hypothetical protein